MAELASLGIEVQTKGADEGAKKLERLSGAAKIAEASTLGFSNATKASSMAAAASAGGYDKQGAAASRAAKMLELNTVAANKNTAASKMLAFQQRNLQFQLVDVATSIAGGMPLYMVAMQQGGQIAQIWGPGEGGVGRAFSETGKMITGALTRFPLLTAAVSGVGLALGGMTLEMNRASGASVSLGQVAKASLQVLGDYITGALQPIVRAIAPWFWAAWDGVTAGVKTVGNLIINSFRAAFEDVKTVWNAFPDIISASVLGATNLVISAVNSMVNAATEGLNVLIRGVNSFATTIGADKAAEWLGFNSKIDELKAPTIPPMANPAAERLSGVADKRNAAIAAIMADDPLGQFYSDVSAKVAAGAAKVAEGAEKSGGALRNAADSATKAWERMEEAIERTRQSLGEDLGGILNGIINKTMNWKDALLEAGKSLLRYFDQMNINQGGQGLFGGGIFGGLMKGILGFQEGGYTGSGAADIAAGEAGKELTIRKNSKPLLAANQNVRLVVPQKESA